MQKLAVEKDYWMMQAAAQNAAAQTAGAAAQVAVVQASQSSHQVPQKDLYESEHEKQISCQL